MVISGSCIRREIQPSELAMSTPSASSIQGQQLPALAGGQVVRWGKRHCATGPASPRRPHHPGGRDGWQPPCRRHRSSLPLSRGLPDLWRPLRLKQARNRQTICHMCLTISGGPMRRSRMPKEEGLSAGWSSWTASTQSPTARGCLRPLQEIRNEERTWQETVGQVAPLMARRLTSPWQNGRGQSERIVGKGPVMQLYQPELSA